MELALQLLLVTFLLLSFSCLSTVPGAWMRCSVGTHFQPVCSRSTEASFLSGEDLVITTLVAEPLLCYAWVSGSMVLATELLTSRNPDPSTNVRLPFALVHVLPLEVPGAYLYLLSCNTSYRGPKIPAELYRPTPVFFGDHSLFSPLPTFSVSGRLLPLPPCKPCGSGDEPG
eukprot:RCo000593